VNNTPAPQLAALLAGLPPAMREALEAQDVQAFDLALRQLEPSEAQRVLAALAGAGVVAARSDDDLDNEQRAAYGRDSE
jgi:hypothetical protein